MEISITRDLAAGFLHLRKSLREFVRNNDFQFVGIIYFIIAYLTGHENIAMFAGMAGLSDQASLSTGFLLLAQILWIAVPLGLAALAFNRRSL